ncbi:MAG: NapC/NirT family cytochrome c, partial [Candidatus Paceibacteria bacterium]
MRKDKLLKWKKWRWFLIGGFIFIFLFAVAAEFTSRSNFCSVCHYMKPFYESWKASSHDQIECQVCHYPPGLKSKFRAKIEGLL